MIKLVLVRHGESVWNLENRFTGWTDVKLSEKGISEAQEAGQKLKDNGFMFDIAYTSFLKRAINTLEIILKELNLSNIEVIKSIKLNERHYGALQGLNKEEVTAKYGEKQVLMWRRSILETPPPVTKEDPRFPGNNPMYTKIPLNELPLTENLQMTIDRVVPFYKQIICPQITKGKLVIISAHGNSLRALVKILEKLNDKQVLKLNIPTGKPLIYELNDCLDVVSRYYL